MTRQLRLVVGLLVLIPFLAFVAHGAWLKTLTEYARGSESVSPQLKASVEQLKAAVEQGDEDRVAELLAGPLHPDKRALSVSELEALRRSAEQQGHMQIATWIANAGELIKIAQAPGPEMGVIRGISGPVYDLMSYLRDRAQAAGPDTPESHVEPESIVPEAEQFFQIAQSTLQETLSNLRAHYNELSSCAQKSKGEQELKSCIDYLKEKREEIARISPYWGLFEAFESTLTGRARSLDPRHFYAHPVLANIDTNDDNAVVTALEAALATATPESSEFYALRQMLYVLGNPVSKAAYDRYLRGQAFWDGSFGSRQMIIELTRNVIGNTEALRTMLIHAKLARADELPELIATQADGKAQALADALGELMQSLGLAASFFEDRERELQRAVAQWGQAGPEIDLAENLKLAVLNEDAFTVAQLLSTAQEDDAFGIDFPDSEGKTALMIAVQAGNNDIVTQLLNAGADPNQRDQEQKTATSLALEYGQDTILNLLLQQPNIVVPSDEDLVLFEQQASRNPNSAIARAVWAIRKYKKEIGEGGREGEREKWEVVERPSGEEQWEVLSPSE